MKPSDVRARLKAIEEMADDDEVEHGMEDGLRADALRYIADEATSLVEAKAMAVAVLQTEGIEFSRWCA